MNLLLLGSLPGVLLGWLMGFLSVFLILLILIQRGKGGGLTGALGGPGGQSAFGSKAGDTFTLITVIVASIWAFVCAFTMWLLGAHPPAVATPPETSITAGPGDTEADQASTPADAATQPDLGQGGIGPAPGEDSASGAEPATGGESATGEELSLELTPAETTPGSGAAEEAAAGSETAPPENDQTDDPGQQ